MVDLINLSAESGRNIIGDDSTPTLELQNTSTGNALSLKSGATEAVALVAANTVISSPTVAVMRLTTSGASAPFFEFKGFLASIASAGSIVRGIRVKFGDEYGFLPVYASGTYI